MKRISPSSYRSGQWFQHVFPVLIWLGVIAGVVGLFYHRSQRFEVLGIVQGRVHHVAATCTGRLKSVPVELFEEVSRGQILAVVDTVLDDERLQAELATISAEIEHLMAQLVPTQDSLLAEAANLENNKIVDKRRFSVDVEAARLQILELKTLLETDRIMLEDLALEVRIIQELLEQDAIAPYELQKVKVQYNALAKKIEENEHLLEQAKQDLKQSQERRYEFAQRQLQHPSVESALEVIRKAIKVQERRMEELLARHEALVLKSPFDGVVIQIQGRARDVALRRPGESILRRPDEVVLAGEPILTIAELEPSEIIAYVTEDQVNQIREGMAVELIKSSEPAQIARSQVIYVGPAVEQMPVRLWRNPNIPEWGRPFLVKAPPQMRLIIGEGVGIRRL